MSGAEGIALVGLISACIGITKTIIDIGRAVNEAQGLPPKLREIFQQIPAIEDLLEAAQESYDNGKSVSKEASNSAEPVLKQCEEALGKMRDIFRKACPKDNDKRGKRIWKGAKAVFFGSGSQLQKHLKTIQDDLKLLEQKEILTIGDKLDELQQITEALARDDSGKYMHTGSGNIIANEGGSPTTYVTGGESNRQVNNPGVYHEGPAKRRETLPKPSSNIPYRRDNDFIDRKVLTDQIRDKCSVPAARIALVGLGGVGKSQIAIEYGYRVRAQSPTTWVLWISTSNAARYEQGVRDIADLVKISGRKDPTANIFVLLRNWLRDETKGNWVIILDNAEDAGFLFERDGQTSLTLFECLPVCDHGTYLITARGRNAALKLVTQDDLIMVEAMDEEQSKALLKQKLGSPADEADIAALVAALDYMPLAITQAAVYLYRLGRRCSVQQYIEKIQKSGGTKVNVLDEDEEDLRRDSDTPNAIMLTWRVSFEHIRSIQPTAADLLSLMSWCDRQAIPSSILQIQEKDIGKPEETSTEQRSRHREELDQNNGSDTGGVETSDSSSDETDEASPDDNFDNDIALLEGYSFVFTTTDSSTFGMHRLVQLATRRWLTSEKQQNRWKEQLACNLSVVFPEGDFETWETCQSLYPQVKAVMNLKLKSRNALLQQASVMYAAGNFAQERGALKDSEEMLERCMKVRIRHLGASHPDTSRCMSRLSQIYLRQGRLDEAHTLAVEATETFKMVVGKEHPDTLRSIRHLSSAYIQQGRLTEGQELLVETTEVSKRILGDADPDTLMNLNNLAIIYSLQGRLSEAEELLVKLLEESKKVLGETHPYTLKRINNLAKIHREQGHRAEAEKSMVEVVESSKKVLGQTHPDTLRKETQLVKVHLEQGQIHNAEELMLKVLESEREVLGDTHPNTLSSEAKLADIYRRQGRLDLAEKQALKALKAMRETSCDSPFFTMDCTAYLARIYRDQGKLNEAEELAAKLVQSFGELLGDTNPYFGLCESILAEIYRKQGRLIEAEELAKKGLEKQRHCLGATSHDAVSDKACITSIYQGQGRPNQAEGLAIDSLGKSGKTSGETRPAALAVEAILMTVYQDQGRLDKAEEVALKVLEGRRDLLGENNPTTLLSIALLAEVYQKQGRLDKAEKLSTEALAGQRKILGETNPTTQDIKSLLADIYREQGRLDEAEELATEVVAEQTNILGETNLTTLDVKATLAGVYQKQGQLAEAEKLATEVAVESGRILGEMNPSTLYDEALLANIYRKQDRLDKAEVLTLKTLEGFNKILGETNPETLSIKAGLAKVYQRQGRLKESEELAVKALEGQRKVLGEANPKTLISMATLAEIYQKQGRLDEAEELALKALEGRRKVLGGAHPETMKSVATLAGIYREQGRSDEADALGAVKQA